MWKSRTDRPLRRARNEISRHEDQQTRRKRSHQFTRWIQVQATAETLLRAALPRTRARDPERVT